jgi:protein scribble
VGLRLLEVNQQSLLGLTHAEAVQLLRSVGDTLTVLVCDGFDTSTTIALEVSDLPWDQVLPTTVPWHGVAEPF